MSTRSVLGMVFTLEALKAQGIDPKPVLQRFGIDLKRLSPEAEIDRALELRIYSQLADQFTSPLLGLEIGKSMSLAGYGPFIMLLMTCQNAWEAFQIGIRYQSLTYLFGELSLEPGPVNTELSFQPVPLPPGCRRFLIDRDVSGTYQLIRDIQTQLGTDIQPVCVRLPYPKPDEHKAYTARFQCPVEFAHGRVSMILKSEALAVKFPGASRMAHELYRNQCNQVLEDRQRRAQTLPKLSEQVRAILELYTAQFPAAHEVALILDLSERSLRRKLSEEGSAFRKILDQVRAQKACELLTTTTQSIESIAQQLGYAESAAFIHAFQRWHNLTPAAYRAQRRLAL